MKIYFWIVSRLSMKYERDLFLDRVTGDMVKLYSDCFGAKWMSVSKWGFRTRRMSQ
jgi:hypothetical protein